jgi:hypothetical protein
MKKITSISLLFLIIFSCSKTEDLLKVDCSHSFGYPPGVTCSGSICQSDTCNNYLDIWKELFLTKNQMTEQYFNNHITLCNTAVYKYANQGIQFEITYKFSVDWFETSFEEGFMIWIFPSYLQNNPTVNLPGETLLSKDQISNIINNPFFGYAIHTISPIDHLRYSSKQEAIYSMARTAGVKDMCVSTLSIQYMNIDNPPLGHPILEASAVLNWDENRCVSGIMDLSTDYLKTDSLACIITFCFTRGTQIIQSINLAKPIEKIKPGDRIISFDMNSMKIGNDIVEQVDSVIHSDIVRITFNDRTINDNTFDHPYYVKSKGWCSYEPSLTFKKYNLQTKQLLIGDTCLKYKDNRLIEVRIHKITETPGEVMTYNISRLKINKTFFANGILVSNEQN